MNFDYILLCSWIKNDFEITNFEMLEEVVHNVGKSDNDII